MSENNKDLPKELAVDGCRYVREDLIPSVPVAPSGKRAIIVVDRGWVWAGDVERKDGRIYLSRAVWCVAWQKGIDKLMKDPKGAGADLRKVDTVVDIPEAAELFALPVPDNWGL